MQTRTATCCITQTAKRAKTLPNLPSRPQKKTFLSFVVEKKMCKLNLILRAHIIGCANEQAGKEENSSWESVDALTMRFAECGELFSVPLPGCQPPTSPVVKFHSLVILLDGIDRSLNYLIIFSFFMTRLIKHNENNERE